MAQHTPFTTGLVGTTAAGAGALIVWLIGKWHGGIPDAAAGFLGALTLALAHAGLAKLGLDDSGDTAAPPQAAAAPPQPAQPAAGQ